MSYINHVLSFCHKTRVTVRLSHDAGLVNSGEDNQETKKKEEHEGKENPKEGKKQEQDLLRNKCSLKSSPLRNMKPLKYSF
jgi:hypothetical protein